MLFQFVDFDWTLQSTRTDLHEHLNFIHVFSNKINFNWCAPLIGVLNSIFARLWKIQNNNNRIIQKVRDNIQKWFIGNSTAWYS